jgi:hypothetical protein
MKGRKNGGAILIPTVFLHGLRSTGTRLQEKNFAQIDDKEDISEEEEEEEEEFEYSYALRFPRLVLPFYSIKHHFFKKN